MRGGFVHAHLGSSTRNEGSIWSDHHPRLLVSSHCVHGGIAITTQFPAISLNGFGSLSAVACGHTHIAIPIHSVKVGATYILTCDEYGHAVVIGRKVSVGHLNGAPKIPKNGTNHPGASGKGILDGKVSTGTHFPSVSVSHFSGSVKHPMI